ncbi:MAG: histidine kinase dimerization/phospho-acceptor domain-containing protein [candidate division Zixibacteria bacterium]|nr:histidine kinase dimerization/phospho-acceptor domain-containing protein [candidate division Zixibacteria bacterium]MDD5425056.1 histidine kinase dimerization/phospho-acceptor domain-containing protein [candidate division Zixibacteria bacterium]
MEDRNSDRYEILRQLALAGVRGEELQSAIRLSLEQAARVVGLQGAAVYLWDDKMNINIAVSYAVSEVSRDNLDAMEKNLFSSLRREHRLLSAYLSFGGEKPYHSFSLPLYHHQKIFGAVTGIQEGDKKLVGEDVFLEALSAAIALNVIAGQAASEAVSGRDIIDQERLKAIIEVAVTINHEVNNPLTAILGNVQLMLLNQETLDENLRNKLKIIEISALKIKDVTQKLLRLSSARTIKYADDTDMIDLSDEEAD